MITRRYVSADITHYLRSVLSPLQRLDVGRQSLSPPPVATAGCLRCLAAAACSARSDARQSLHRTEQALGRVHARTYTQDLVLLQQLDEYTCVSTFQYGPAPQELMITETTCFGYIYSLYCSIVPSNEYPYTAVPILQHIFRRTRTPMELLRVRNNAAC
jgi:hypothetical protein